MWFEEEIVFCLTIVVAEGLLKVLIIPRNVFELLGIVVEEVLGKVLGVLGVGGVRRVVGGVISVVGRVELLRGVVLAVEVLVKVVIVLVVRGETLGVVVGGVREGFGALVTEEDVVIVIERVEVVEVDVVVLVPVEVLLVLEDLADEGEEALLEILGRGERRLGGLGVGVVVSLDDELQVLVEVEEPSRWENCKVAFFFNCELCQYFQEY